MGTAGMFAILAALAAPVDRAPRQHLCSLPPTLHLYSLAPNPQGENIATTQNFVKDTVAPQGEQRQCDCACRCLVWHGLKWACPHSLWGVPWPLRFCSRHLCPAAVEYTSTSPDATTTDADAVFAFSGDDATGVNFTCTLAARWGSLAACPTFKATRCCAAMPGCRRPNKLLPLLLPAAQCALPHLKQTWPSFDPSPLPAATPSRCSRRCCGATPATRCGRCRWASPLTVPRHCTCTGCCRLAGT